MPAPTSRRPSRVARANARRAQRRRRGRRVAQSGLLVIVALVAVLLPVPTSTSSVACGPVPDGAAIVHLGQLDDDGELRELRQRHLDDDGSTCEQDGEAELDVAVSILHRDDEGRSLEASELARQEHIRTHVSVRDTTARDRELAVVGPTGTVTASRHIGVPQLVRVAVRYPTGWQVEAPSDEGVATTLDGDVVEVARSAMLFAPLLAEELVLEVPAVPGRGTPRITVEATPVGDRAAQNVPDGLLDRDTTAVLAALLELTADGARELTDGTWELADGTDELADGAGELAGGAAELGDGLAGFSDGVAGLSTGVDASASGARELAAGTDELAAGSRELAAGAAPLRQGADELAAGVGVLADELAAASSDPGPDVDPQELITALQEIDAGLRQVRDDLQALLPPEPDPTAPLTVAVGVLTGLSDGLVEVAAGLEEALRGLAEVSEGLQAAAAGTQELAAGAEELAAGIAEFQGALAGLADGAAGLAAGSQELAGGLGQLSGASDELTGGARELTDGAHELASGTDGLAEGTREVADGTRELAEGVSELPDALEEAIGTADRGGERAAVTAAVLDEGAALAQARHGDAARVTTQLLHRGQQPFPWLPVGIGGGVLALLAALGIWWWRRPGGAT